MKPKSRPIAAEAKLVRLPVLFSGAGASKHGLNRITLKRLCDTGALSRLENGIFKKQNSAIDPEIEEYAVACARMGEESYISGLSALSFHNLLNFVPKEIWIVAGRNKRSSTYRIIRSAVDMQGVENIDGIVRIASVERALVDAFRYSTKVTLEHCFLAAGRAFQSGLTSPAKVLRAARNLSLEKFILKHWEALNVE
jgi:predicted transcriptional regulator of viral defense system